MEHLYANSETIPQRDLAQIVGLSLGMTNAILKRLVQKGFLTVRKVNNRNIRYIVSSKGIETITRKSYRFFKRTIKNVALYKEEIEILVQEVKHRGFQSVVLVGISDLDFIVEYSCGKYGLTYLHGTDTDLDNAFLIYSESYIPDFSDEDEIAKDTSAFLQNTLLWERGDLNAQ